MWSLHRGGDDPPPFLSREGMDARPMDPPLRGRKSGGLPPPPPIARGPSSQAAAPAGLRSEAEWPRCPGGGSLPPRCTSTRVDRPFTSDWPLTPDPRPGATGTRRPVLRARVPGAGGRPAYPPAVPARGPHRQLCASIDRTVTFVCCIDCKPSYGPEGWTDCKRALLRARTRDHERIDLAIRADPRFAMDAPLRRAILTIWPRP